MHTFQLVDVFLCFEQLNRRRAKSKSVFDDEDVLFGSKNEEDPAVDLFGSGSPVSPEKVCQPYVIQAFLTWW